MFLPRTVGEGIPHCCKLSAEAERLCYTGERKHWQRESLGWQGRARAEPRPHTGRPARLRAALAGASGALARGPALRPSGTPGAVGAARGWGLRCPAWGFRLGTLAGSGAVVAAAD